LRSSRLGVGEAANFAILDFNRLEITFAIAPLDALRKASHENLRNLHALLQSDGDHRAEKADE
jgi:hypothetical protein